MVAAPPTKQAAMNTSTKRPFQWIFEVAGVIAAFFIFAIFALMLGSTLLREMGLKTGGTEDIVGWLTAAAAFFGLAHTFKHGDFVRVTLLLEKMPPARRRVVEIINLIMASAFTAYITSSVTRYVYDSWQYNDMGTGMIALPLWIPQSSLVIGSLLLCLAFIDELIWVIRGHRPVYVTAVEERHARGDFSEDV
jgi:TRAP-type C4-dicarboxylate transport system permease small subunit